MIHIRKLQEKCCYLWSGQMTYFLHGIHLRWKTSLYRPILGLSPQIGSFSKKAPFSFLSGYWNGHVLVTIRWIKQKIRSDKPVGLTSLWSSVLSFGYQLRKSQRQTRTFCDILVMRHRKRWYQSKKTSMQATVSFNFLEFLKLELKIWLLVLLCYTMPVNLLLVHPFVWSSPLLIQQALTDKSIVNS